jgi:plasmid stability protein
MASLTIRNLDDELKSMLRFQAARHGCSMEQEARDILNQALKSEPDAKGFAERIHQRFAQLDADDLSLPKRRPARLPDTPEA